MPDAVDQVPFRRLFRPLNRPVSEGAAIVTAYTDGVVTLRSNRAKIGYHEAADTSAYQGVERGDFVVHGLDIMRGSVGVADSAGAMSSVCIVCEPSVAVDPRYYAYVIRMQAASGFPKALARGVREGGADFRRWDTLAELPLPVMPVREQRQIANFLDDQISRVDAVGAVRRQQLDAIGEASRAARSTLVSSPGVAMLDGPLRRFVRLRDGQRIPLSVEQRSTRKGDYPYYGASGVIDHIDDYLFDGKRLLVSEDGANLLLRSTPIAFVATGRYWVNNHAHIVEPTDECFSFWAARVEAVDLTPWVSGSAQPKLTADALLSLPVSAPISSTVRRAIESELELEAAETAQKVSDLERSIGLLVEYKRSLTTAAITGEFDVAAASGRSIPA